MRIGIDLGGTKIEGIVMAPDGRIALRRRRPTPAGDYDGTVAAIAGLANELGAEASAQGAPVGVAMPGAISPRTGLVKNANSTCLNGRPFLEDLERALARPVRVANDANCFALSEARDGAGQGHGVVFGVILGTGVGGGLVVDGRIVGGPNAIGGEWGHNPLPWPTPAETPGAPCYCGKRGCIETWCSGPAVSRIHAEQNGINAPLEEIVHDAAHDSACAQATIEALALRVGKSLATVVNVVDPDIIVLGGGVSNIAALYALVPPAITRYAFSDGVSTPVVRNVHGDSSGVRGAAWLFPP